MITLSKKLLFLAVFLCVVSIFLNACGENPAVTALSLSTAAPTTVVSTATTAPTVNSVPTVQLTPPATKPAALPLGIPNHPDKFEVQVPRDSQVKLETDFTKLLPDVKITLFAVRNVSVQISEFYKGFFIQEGWKSNEVLARRAKLDMVLDKKDFFLAYHKNDNQVVMMGVDRLAAKNLGINGLSSSEALVLIVTGREITMSTANITPISVGLAPYYPNGVKIATSQETKKAVLGMSDAGLDRYDADIIGFYSSDGINNVKNFYTNFYDKAGWSNETNIFLNNSSTLQEHVKAGGLVLNFSTINNDTFVISYTPTAARRFNITNIPNNALLYLVVTQVTY